MALSYKILAQEVISYTSVETVPTEGYGYYGGNIGNQGSSDTQYTEQFLPVTVYTVPPGKSTIVTSIFIVNHDSTASTYDLAVVPAGESLALKHHLRWDYSVAGDSFDNITTKITMSAGDKLVVFPSTVDTVSITAFGVEQ